MKISIIIPTLNEEHNIRRQLEFFNSYPALAELEVIIVDGGSTDKTVAIVQDYAFAQLVISEIAARPNQLNMGAEMASHDLLYFVHADVQLPDAFHLDILKAQLTYDIGCYRYQFDTSHLLLRVNAFFTRFPMMWCRGGDQTLFVKRSLFDALHGFDEYFAVMEDFDIIRRAKALTDFYIIPKNVIVSARKYSENSYWKVQMVNLKAFRMFKKGIAPLDIRSFYKEALGLKNY